MLMFLFKSNVYHPSGTSLLKALFLIGLKGVNFCGFLFWGCFILRELFFADRGQSVKSAKIKTRKIFMLHGTIFCAATFSQVELPFCSDLSYYFASKY